MSKTTTNRARTVLRSRLRTRAAAVTVGVCASAVLATSGVATAAASSAVDAGTTDLFASRTAAVLADSTQSQADTQLAAVDAAKAEKQEAKAKAEEAKEAEQAKARSWVAPISSGDYVLSATYGNSGDRWTSSHSGQDFAVPSGTDVRAVHGGTVVKAGSWGAGDGSAYGNAVVIKHEDGVYSQYAHLSSVGVSVGEKVATGEKVALSGNTGNSTGPHLHFEIRTTPDYGSAVDPVAFLSGKNVSL
ncbi:M23 family metallopeptidase [Streptomyces sp. 4N509B]|uniref:M23 family metallopeptidase n=1 Tax=Streptomyces sp. 4N509B TaxID=3457413 RepID=UPI003FD1A2D7